METIEEIKEFAEKTWNFHRAHDIVLSKHEGVMCVSEAKKLFDKLLSLMEEENKITRVEIIEGSMRKYVKWNCEAETSMQDNGRTLKVFIKDEK